MTREGTPLDQSSATRLDAAEREPLLQTIGLKKYFAVKSGLFRSQVSVKAVDGVDLTLYPGETLGLVGESGCGKTTLGRVVLRLIEPSGGDIIYRGHSILKAGTAQMQELRGRMQIVFQDPWSSLDPRMTVRQILSEAVQVAGRRDRASLDERLRELIDWVGLSQRHLERYPQAFSGGQRQRIGIARALAVNPEFLVCDEPVSALDVSIQSQVLNLFRELQRRLGLAYLFISHDLGVVRYMAHRVAVMYLGRVVETAPRNSLFTSPLHPYTQALLSAIPVANLQIRRERIVLQGEVPSPVNPPAGCPFHPRCPHVMPQCREVVPLLRPVEREISGDGAVTAPTAQTHWVACHLYTEVGKPTSAATGDSTRA